MGLSSGAVEGPSSLQRFTAAIVTTYGVIALSIWAKFGVDWVADTYWSLFGTSVAIAVIALSYSLLISSLGVPLSKVWKLPDAATVTLGVPGAEALARVRVAAAQQNLRLQVEPRADGLRIVRPSLMLGSTSIQVAVAENDGGTALRLDVKSPRFINNGIGRGLLYRLIAGLGGSDEQNSRPLLT
jgi:hypothetical protein